MTRRVKERSSFLNVKPVEPLKGEGGDEEGLGASSSSFNWLLLVRGGGRERERWLMDAQKGAEGRGSAWLCRGQPHQRGLARTTIIIVNEGEYSGTWAIPRKDTALPLLLSLRLAANHHHGKKYPGWARWLSWHSVLCWFAVLYDKEHSTPSGATSGLEEIQSIVPRLLGARYTWSTVHKATRLNSTLESGKLLIALTIQGNSDSFRNTHLPEPRAFLRSCSQPVILFIDASKDLVDSDP
ncbi:hypothetical protein C8F04DRAFT_1289207 [Mycena alexandri]|uniref:Uncharacterized protein n=1 Tax=Mycena alexandri TaxID=1745969 RepID=A0AAD6SKL1_9AGAR|nr:hypothetical protein C8F04DRAFT_1289207 [Mycena alexandri]